MTNLVTYLLLSKLPYLKDLIAVKPINEQLPDGTWDGSLTRGLRFNIEFGTGNLETSGKIVGEFTDEYGTWTIFEFHYVTGEISSVISVCNILSPEERYKLITDYRNKIKHKK